MEKSVTALTCKSEAAETALSTCGFGAALLTFLPPIAGCASAGFNPLEAEDEAAQVFAMALAMNKQSAPG